MVNEAPYQEHLKHNADCTETVSLSFFNSKLVPDECDRSRLVARIFMRSIKRSPSIHMAMPSLVLQPSPAVMRSSFRTGLLTFRRERSTSTSTTLWHLPSRMMSRQESPTSSSPMILLVNGEKTSSLVCLDTHRSPRSISQPSSHFMLVFRNSI